MTADGELRAALQELLDQLEVLGTDHGELYDTDVRQQMFEAVLNSFLKPQPGYVLPETFGMFDPAADAAVRAALLAYATRASARAGQLKLMDPNDRLAAFQDSDVQTKQDEQQHDEFFGWAESI